MNLNQALAKCSLYQAGHPVARQHCLTLARTIHRCYGLMPLPGSIGQITYARPDNQWCIDYIGVRQPSVTLSLCGRPTDYAGLGVDDFLVSPRPGCVRLRWSTSPEFLRILGAVHRSRAVARGLAPRRSSGPSVSPSGSSPALKEPGTTEVVPRGTAAPPQHRDALVEAPNGSDHLCAACASTSSTPAKHDKAAPVDAPSDDFLAPLAEKPTTNDEARAPAGSDAFQVRSSEGSSGTATPKSEAPFDPSDLASISHPDGMELKRLAALIAERSPSAMRAAACGIVHMQIRAGNSGPLHRALLELTQIWRFMRQEMDREALTGVALPYYPAEVFAPGTVIPSCSPYLGSTPWPADSHIRAWLDDVIGTEDQLREFCCFGHAEGETPARTNPVLRIGSVPISGAKIAPLYRDGMMPRDWDLERHPDHALMMDFILALAAVEAHTLTLEVLGTCVRRIRPYMRNVPDEQFFILAVAITQALEAPGYLRRVRRHVRRITTKGVVTFRQYIKPAWINSCDP